MTELDDHQSSQLSATQQEIERKRSAYRISLTTAVIMGVIAILAAGITIFLKEYSYYGAITTGALSLAAFLSFGLVRKGRPYAGITVLCLSIILFGTGLNFFAKTPSLGLAVFIMVSGISAYALPPRWAGWMTAAGFVAGIVTVLLAIYGPSLGLYTNQNVSNIAVGILTIIYLFVVIRRYPTFSVRTKLVLFTLIVVQVPLAVLTTLQNSQQTANLQAELEAQLHKAASQAAKDMDGFIAERRNAILGEAQIPAIADYLQMPPDERPNSDKELETARILLTYRTKDIAYVQSYAILDTNGLVLLDTDIRNIGQSEADYSYILPPIVNGFPYASPIEYSGDSQNPQFVISAPVFNTEGKIVGILRARYNASVFQDRLTDALANQPTSMYGVLVDERYLIRIAHTTDTTLVNKTYLSLDDNTILRLQTSKRLPSNIPAQELQHPDTQIAAGLLNSNIEPVFETSEPLPGQEPEFVATAHTENVNWIVAIHQPTEIIAQRITEQTNASIVLALIATSIALLAAIGVSEVFVRPIRQLTSTAQQVASGNLNIQAKVYAQDEIGVLATTFNATTNQLRETLESLEQRVAERTAELEKTSIANKKQAELLQTIGDVTSIIASEQNIETLLPLITELVSERFGFYHAGIFLNDDTNLVAILRAANSEGGKRMLERRHRLRVGQEGIVGYVTGSGKNRIALDVGEDAVFFNNPDLPETRSEMALPLIARGRIIGALDIQSTISNAFSVQDAAILQVLADQVAIAIENARLYDETRQALAEIETLNRQYLAEKWQGIAAKRTVLGFSHNLANETKPLTQLVEQEEIHRAVQTGEVTISINSQDNKDKPAIAIPITIRGEVLATLHIQSNNPDRQWSASEIALLRTLADRIGAALETARLFEDAERRANKERLIGDVSAKIGASIDFQNILHTAVEELGRVIPGSDVIIQLKQDEQSRDNSK
jgi:GAF domain-containing protein/HAMP domain-containing protein